MLLNDKNCIIMTALLISNIKALLLYTNVFRIESRG